MYRFGFGFADWQRRHPEWPGPGGPHFGHPHHRHEGEGRGPGGPPGPGGPHGRGRGRPWGGENWREWGRGRFGPGGPGGPRVDRGEVKYLILSVLEAGPKHGYEIMRAIEERSQGTYVPSAGTVYPTLQMLEDLGQIQGQEAEGRRVFTLTDAGRAYLAEHQDEARAAWGRVDERGGRREELRELREEMGGLARSLFAEGRIFRASPTQLARVRDIVRSTRQQIDAALGEYV